MSVRRFCSPTAARAVLLGLMLTVGACSDATVAPDDTGSVAPAGAPFLLIDGDAALTIVVPADAGAALTLAGQDLADALEAITGETFAIVQTAAEVTTPWAVLAEIDGDDVSGLGDQGYRLAVDRVGSAWGVRVTAANQVGAAYGIYHLLADLGVHYFHPKQTYFPSAPDATLPWDYVGETEAPHFAQRGFHEHTQHPIVMSDYYLRPEAAFAGEVEAYFRWLVRNRQNAASWQMLKTVDLDEWLPYISPLIETANGYGIDVGMVISFVDEQQHMFKLLDTTLEADSEGEADQITGMLDRLAGAGFGFFGLQIGSSEFTKPADEKMLEWLQVAVDWSQGRDVPIPLSAWIHTTCELEAEDGSHYFHLPLQSDPALGAWLHTTMFYTLDHPAPVYGCDSFAQQVDFLEAADGTRPITYFPETAWWLGFDNNAPITLPITGWSRWHDIAQALADHDVQGHITFTSGREWSYWQYDHYLTQVTWAGGELSWDDYLASIAPLYGDQGAEAVAVVQAWTDEQRTDFYDNHPLIYFYLAGELRQDELGQQAGILARRPKLAFSVVARYDEDEFAAWLSDDFEYLEAMLPRYQALLDQLTAPEGPGDTLETTLYYELYNSFYVYVRRIEHAIALYSGVAATHGWVAEVRAEGEEADEDVRADALERAEAALGEARAITAEMLELFEAMEGIYRYDLDLLARAKPESPTAYPFGYLEQTSTGHFWTRRDDQLESLIAREFQTVPEAWSSTPDAVFYTDAGDVELLEPDNPVAGDVLAGFIPRMLFALSEVETESLTLAVGQDANENFVPDILSEEVFACARAGDSANCPIEEYTMTILNSTGEVLGDLTMLQGAFDLTLEGDSLVIADMAGDVLSETLIQMVMIVGGIDRDGVVNLVKAIFNLRPNDELPARVPVRFRLTFHPVEE